MNEKLRAQLERQWEQKVPHDEKPPSKNELGMVCFHCVLFTAGIAILLAGYAILQRVIR